MKVYIAAPWLDRDLVPAVAEQFEDAGFVITERWWTHRDVNGHEGPEAEQELADQAQRDFLGVVEADAFVLINTRVTSGGKEVETGIAMTMGLPVVVIGTRSNVFHYMPAVEFVSSAAEAITALRQQ